MRITSPDKTYTGTSVYGTTALKFKNGAADHDGELPAGVRLYLQSAGYGINGEATPPATPELVDPRFIEEHIRIGGPLRDAATDPNAAPEHTQSRTKLRDAAVDPRPEDYQAPVVGAAGPPVSVQALSPRSGNPPAVHGADSEPTETP